MPRGDVAVPRPLRWPVWGSASWLPRESGIERTKIGIGVQRPAILTRPVDPGPTRALADRSQFYRRDTAPDLLTAPGLLVIIGFASTHPW
jgi:hypothetical protein